MSARAEWEYKAECNTCRRRTTLAIPDFQKRRARIKLSGGAVVTCPGAMRRRDVIQGDETEFPIRGVASTGDRHA